MIRILNNMKDYNKIGNCKVSPEHANHEHMHNILPIFNHENATKYCGGQANHLY